MKRNHALSSESLMQDAIKTSELTAMPIFAELSK